MKQGSQINNIREFLSVIFKYKHEIFIIIFTITLTVIIATFLMTPVYEAKSSILVKFGREYIYQPEIGNSSPLISMRSFDQQDAISSEIQIIRSKDIMEKVIKAIGIKTLYPDIFDEPSLFAKYFAQLKRKIKFAINIESETKAKNGVTPLTMAINRFSKNLTAVALKNSSVIEISFRHRDPDLAARIVNQLVDFYKEKHLEVLSNPKSSFFENKLLSYRNLLKESENRLESFKQKYNIFSIDEQRSLLLQQRGMLDSSLKSLENRIQEIRQVLSDLDHHVLNAMQGTVFNPENDRYRVIDDAKTELLSLQLREKELLGKYKSSSRFVRNVRKEIRHVKEFIEEQEKGLVASELASLMTKKNTIASQIKTLDEKLRALDDREKEYKNLKREVDVNERNYRVYLTKVEEARISEEMDRQKMANIGLIQEAYAPDTPIRPRKFLNIVLGLIIGLLSGAAYAFLSDHFSSVFHTPETAEYRLKLPVLASIPFQNNITTRSHPMKWSFGGVIIFLLLLGIVWNKPYLHEIQLWFDDVMQLFSSQTNGGVKTEYFEQNRSASSNKKTNSVGLLLSTRKDIIPELDSLPGNKSKAVSSIVDINITSNDNENNNSALVIPLIHKPVLQRRLKTPRWTINATSTLIEDNALYVFNQLKDAGYSTYITKFRQGDRLWYRVRVGFYNSRSEALTAAQDLSSNYSLNKYWVTKATPDEILIVSN